MAGAAVYFEGLKEVQRELRRLGASLEDFKAVNKAAAEIVEDRAKHLAPKDTGRLRAAIFSTSTKTEGKVIASARVPYMGVIHFGWSTRGIGRGLTRVEVQERARGVLARRTANKAYRTSRARTVGGRAVGAVRGGPIRPNPFLYDAADDRRDAVYEEYDRQVDGIAKRFNDAR